MIRCFITCFCLMGYSLANCVSWGSLTPLQQEVLVDYRSVWHLLLSEDQSVLEAGSFRIGKADQDSLQGFNELDDALNFADDIAIGVDWSDRIEANHSDFTIDIVDLLHNLIKRNQTTILVYSLNGDYPYIPAGTSSNLDMYLAYLSNTNVQPSWAKEVFLFE